MDSVEEKSVQDRADKVKLPVPKPIIVILICVLFISIYSFIKFPASMKDYKTYLTAPTQAL